MERPSVQVQMQRGWLTQSLSGVNCARVKGEGFARSDVSSLHQLSNAAGDWQHFVEVIALYAEQTGYDRPCLVLVRRACDPGAIGHQVKRRAFGRDTRQLVTPFLTRSCHKRQQIRDVQASAKFDKLLGQLFSAVVLIESKSDAIQPCLA